MNLEQLFRGTTNYYIEASFIKDNGIGNKATKHTTFKSKAIHGPAPIEEHKLGRAKMGSSLFVDKYNVGYAAIDIDIYPTNHKQLIQQLKKNKFGDAVVVKSTSGGAHIFFIFEEDVAAVNAIKLLEHVSEELGYKDSKPEIFPKQETFDPVWNAEKNNGKGGWEKVGNNIYWPYGKDKSCGLDDEGNELTLEEFEKFAATKIVKKFDALPKPSKNRKIKTSHAKNVSTERTNTQLPVREVLLNGPPCLIQLNTSGVDKGGRNEAMFNFAILLKKANGKADMDNMQLFNNLNDPELNKSEVESITASVNSGDYTYRCKEEPLKTYCNKNKCVKKKFGKFEEDEINPDYPYLFVKKRVVITDTRDGQIISPTDFNYILKAERYFTEDGTQLDNTNKYITSNDTEKVNDIVFEPMKDVRFNEGHKKVYNTYRPHDLEPVAGRIKPWTDLIKFLIPDKHYRHLFNQWCAHLIQKPGEKMHWSPLLITKQGSGKGTLHQGLANCLGQQYVELLDISLLTGDFTGHLERKLLLTLDETKETQKNRTTIMNNLKMLITESRVKIRRLYTEAFWIRNVCNYMLFSNYKTAVTLTEDARRFMVWINDELPKEPEFYDEVWKVVEEQPGIILKYYLEYDCQPTKDFKPKGRAPITPHFATVVDATDRPEFTTLEIMYSEKNYPFHRTSPYVNIGHLSKAFHDMGHRNLNIPTIKSWLQWRKTAKKALDLGQIYWAGHKPTIWTLEPETDCIKAPTKLQKEYYMPTDLRFQNLEEITPKKAPSWMKNTD